MLVHTIMNWHGETEILILLKGRIEMSCNDEVFTLEPLDTVIISPQVGHSTLALEEDVIALQFMWVRVLSTV